MKKLISLLVAIVLVAALIPAAFAADDETLTFQVVSVKPDGSAENPYLKKGDVVTVAVYQSGPKIVGFGLTGLYYDQNELKLVGPDDDGDGAIDFTPMNGISYILQGPGGVQAAGTGERTDRVVFTMQFEILVDSGELGIGFATGNGGNLKQETFEAKIIPGVIVVGAPHQHEIAEWKVTKEPTCTEKGIKTAYCACGHVMGTEEIDMIPHTEEKVEGYAATCTEPGKTDGLKCSVCGTVLKAQEEIPALGHVWGEAVVADYDCDKGGAEVYTCSVCGETKTVDLPAHDHNFAGGMREQLEEATYEKGGKVRYYCAHRADHGCSAFEDKDTPPLSPDEPDPYGDITPYITMGVVTVVALISAAAYLFLKRKAV